MPRAAEQVEVIPLPAAALRLRKSWAVCWRLMLEGQPRGEKRGSRYFVRLDDVERFEREMHTRAGAAL